MRDIKAQLESYQEHLDALYPAVTTEELSRATVESNGSQVRSSHPSWRRGLAFGSAFLLVLGLGSVSVLLSDRTESARPGDVVTTLPPPPTTSALPSTTGSRSTTTATTDSPPPTPAPEPPTPDATEGFFQLNEGSGFPIAPGVTDSDGRLVMAYWSQEEHAMMLLRCADPSCIGPSEIAKIASLDTFWYEGEAHPPYLDDMALRPDGSPIVIIQSADSLSHMIYACADPGCSTIEAAPLDIPAAFWQPQLAIAPDGLPRIVYGTVNFGRGDLEMAVCRDAVCGSSSTVRIEAGVVVQSNPLIRIEPDGRLLIGYTTGGFGDDRYEVKIAVCADDSCARGPTLVTIDDAHAPRITTGLDGSFFVWYRRGPREMDGALDVNAILEGWDLMVASCDSGGCGIPERVEVPWALLSSWEDAKLVTMPDGNVAAVYSYWSSDDCALLLDVAQLDPVLGTVNAEFGHYPGEEIVASEVSPNGSLAMVILDDAGTLHLREVSLVGPSQTSPGSPSPACTSP